MFDRDYGTFREWSDLHSMVAPVPDDLPLLGWVVEECVMGFVALADGRMGLVCHLLSDPRAARSRVAKACFKLQTIVLEEAKAMGLTKLLAQTSHPGVAKGMLRGGWELFPKRMCFEREV
jgi:hypothetical protein